MLRILSLFLPALAPSWRFFEEIKPAPRIEYAVIEPGEEGEPDWAPFRPPPQDISLQSLVARLVFSPTRNEDLYLLTCAEKVMLEQSEHGQEEILRRIRADFRDRHASVSEAQQLQMRILTVQRTSQELVTREAHRSEVVSVLRPVS